MLQHFPAFASAMVGCDIAIVSGQRFEEEQRKLYAKGRTVSSGICVCAHHPLGKVVTNAPHAEDTAHGRCMALDFCPVEGSKYLWPDEKGITPEESKRREEFFVVIGELAERNGFVWGGRWTSPRDLGHIELEGWRNIPYRKDGA